MKISLFAILLSLLPGLPISSEAILKDTFRNDFIGAAVSYGQANGKDRVGRALLEKHFSSVTPENMLKWGAVHPEPGV
ncbi:MAG: endo-1,4-beta-xylanase [Cyclobacteriaceae bacterium]